MDKPEPPPCDHEWRRVRDWYGDPNVINGTCDIEFWRCRKCGAEAEAPDDAGGYVVDDYDDRYE